MTTNFWGFGKEGGGGVRSLVHDLESISNSDIRFTNRKKTLLFVSSFSIHSIIVSEKKKILYCSMLKLQKSGINVTKTRFFYIYIIHIKHLMQKKTPIHVNKVT